MKYLDKIIEYAILLFVFLIPWQARWIISLGQINGGAWEYGTQSLYATEVLLAGILVLVIIRFSVETLHATSLPSWREWFLSPYGVLLLFLIYAGISVFWAIDKNTALIHWRFLVEAGAVMLILSSGFVKREKIQWAIILSAVIQAMWGIGQFLVQSIPASTILGMAQQSADVLGASVVETLDGRWLRAYGSFPHPNILGAWLVLGLIVIIKKIQDTRYKQIQIFNIQSLFLYASFTVILFGLLATFSRSAWLALLLLIAYRLLLAFCRLKPWSAIGKIIAITALTTIVFAAFFPQPFLTRLNGGNRLEVKSETEHIASWRESWQIIKEHPLLGVGVGNYGLAVHRDIDSTQPAYYYQPTHNVFLLIWAELGIAGLLIIAYSLLLIAYKNRKFLVGAAAPLLPLLIFSLFDHYLWSLYPGLMIGAVYLTFLPVGLDKSSDLV